MVDDPGAVEFRRPDENENFAARHPVFLEVLPRSMEVANKVFSRVFPTDKPEERVIFLLGRLAVEDFNEILLNAGNGAGVAALKLLRPMFEDVVTSMYLARNRSEVSDFLEYHHVHFRKALTHMRTSGIDVEQRYGRDLMDQNEATYQRIKRRYTEVLCATCGKTREQGSWTKKGLDVLAKAVGMERGYFGFSFVPTLQLHTTVSRMMIRLQQEDGGLKFLTGPQRTEADYAVRAAHTCLVHVLDDQSRYFGLALDAEIDALKRDLERCVRDEPVNEPR